MDPPTHIIDPDGEVVIVLLNADSPFAVPREDMIAHGFSRTLPQLNDIIQNTAEDMKHPEDYMDTPKPTFRGKRRGKSDTKMFGLIWNQFHRQ